MKKIVFLLVFICVSSFAQTSINNYKYIVVPNQLDFLNKPDKYQTSSLTKFLFTREGFQAYMSNERLPEDLNKNRCLGLIANVKGNSKMFGTKNIIELQDCNGNIIYTSIEGKSKLKDYKKSYHEAIRRAFKSITNLNYSYIPLNKQREKLASPQTNELKRDTRDNTPTRTTSVFRDINAKETNGRTSNNNTKNRVPQLYAQPINKGFQLFNIKRQVVFTVLETNLKNIFVVENKNGILYKEGNIWVADFYDVNQNKIVRKYDIRVKQRKSRR